MNKYYEKLMELKEAEEYKPVVEGWKVLSERLKTRPLDAPVLLPDMFWVARSGVGKTNLLRLSAEYLSSLGNLMEFYGDVKYMEFLLEYCPPGAPFTELSRLIDEVDNAAGFRNEYKGIVYVDVNEWIDHYEEKHFVTFMEYMAANSDGWLIVLSAHSESKKKMHNFYAFLAMYLRLERVNLSLPKTEELFGFVEGRLAEYGLTLEADAVGLLTDTIEKIRQNKYFDGFKTVNMLCQDIVYDVYSAEKLDSYTLTADRLSKFASDSEYINRTVANIEKVNKIGFGQHQGG